LVRDRVPIDALVFSKAKQHERSRLGRMEMTRDPRREACT